MKIRRFVAIALVCALCIVIATTGCTTVQNTDTPSSTSNTSGSTTQNTTEQPVTIRLAFFQGGFGNAWEVWLKTQYEADHPNVTIQLEGSPQMKDIISADLDIGNEVPDILFMKLDNALKYFQEGKIASLDSLLEIIPDGYDQPLKELINPNYLTPYTDIYKTGEVFALPMNVSIGGFIVNLDILEEYGVEWSETWEGFETMCDTLVAKGMPAIAYPGIYSGYLENFLKPAVAQYFTEEELQEYLNPTSSDILLDDAILKGMQRLEDFLTHDWLLPGVQALDHTQSQMELVNNNVAMQVNGSWLETEMSNALPLEGVNWAMKPIPYPKDAVIQKGTYIVDPGETILVNPESIDNEEVRNFIAFLFSAESAKMWAELAGGFATVPVDTTDLRITNFNRSVLEMLADTEHTMPVLWYGKFATNPEGAGGYDKFMSGTISAQDWYESREGHIVDQFNTYQEQLQAATE